MLGPFIILTSFSFPRFGPSALHQRDPRSALFEGYDGGGGDRARNASSSPSRQGYSAGSYAYNGIGNVSAGLGLAAERPGYRPATPNSRYILLDYMDEPRVSCMERK